NDYTKKMSGQYKGEFKEFTDTINVVIARLISVQDALERLGKGDLSRLEEFEKAGKRSENDRLIPAMVSGLKAVDGIIKEIGALTNATLNGNLSLRGNEDKFEGGYREIIQGFNDTIDAVVKPINEASDVLQEMSNANLTVTMKGEYKGEYAKIKEAINHTSDAFNQMLNEINSAAQQVASGSKQISDSSVALSQGATEQASSIEELTASLEEISSQTKLNAGNANKANELAGNAKSNAVRGNTQMKDMLKAMDEINVSSSNIYKIIKVIDDIAFQTNILALNAAVEAARAGQHGKGFAVVAEEVRTLAARSANAAKETTELIEGSIKKVEAGTKIANDTAEALDKIVDEVEKAANLVSDIAIASNEQATGIDQINQGIMQVSQVVQTNSATSEESAAASEELSSQAELLKEMVGKVKLKKVSQTYNKLEELDPEVMKMIENMYKKKYDGPKSEEDKGEASAAKNAKGKKIYLSENDFGKY
ncbi:MAG: methyl-accepting chemotaxis protein, partial [Clostridiaceae bacterium]